MKNEFVNSRDQSLLLYILKDVFFVPLVKMLPKGLKPNYLTLIGFLSVLLFSYATYMANREFIPGYLLGGLAILIYCIADNIDGMHARNTQQTSRLGGFLDQWLDAVSFLVITMALLSSVKASAPFYLATVMVMALVNIVLYHGQYHSGSFYKPPFGPNELLVTIAVLYFFRFIFHENLVVMAHNELFRRTNLFPCIAIVIGMAYVSMDLSKTKVEMRNFMVPFLLHIGALVPYFMHRIVSPMIIAIILLIINSIFIGRILLSVYDISLDRKGIISLLTVTLPGVKTAAAVIPEEEPLEEQQD